MWNCVTHKKNVLTGTIAVLTPPKKKTKSPSDNNTSCTALEETEWLPILHLITSKYYRELVLPEGIMNHTSSLSNKAVLSKCAKSKN